MAGKLLEGSIYITDEASKALTMTEKELRALEKRANECLGSVRCLNEEMLKLGKNAAKSPASSTLRKMAGQERPASISPSSYVPTKTAAEAKAEMKLEMQKQKLEMRRAKIQSENSRRAERDANAEEKRARASMMMSKSALDRARADEARSRMAANRARAENMAVRRAAKENDIIMMGRGKVPRRLPTDAPGVDRGRIRTEFQMGMERRAASGGALSPLWENLSKFKSVESVLRNPSAVGEGLLASVGKMGTFGRGVAGAIGGRAVGGMFGSPMLGQMAGAGAMAGGAGIAVAAGMAAILEVVKSGVGKVTDYVEMAMDTFTQTAKERAFESVALRRKVQMSNEMFGVENARDIRKIDKKVYGYREYEKRAYTQGLSGRDISTSAIEWLHLLGTKNQGGVFTGEKQAFDFSEALSAISKMNGLSEQEYETVRYQGMQILSKGYADILDIKPLLNSAPGFVRDLLQQTGMSRKELLESGRDRSFTADKFLAALLNVQGYYKVLSDRATSRTPEQQEEASKAIIGQASVYSEMEKKIEAEQNTQVMKATMMSGIMGQMSETWFKMWSGQNDAAEGARNKVLFEKKVTYQIMKVVNEIWHAARIIKNVFDIIFDVLGAGVMFIGNMFRMMVLAIKDGIMGAISQIFSLISYLPGMGDYAQKSEEWDPYSALNRRRKFSEEVAPKIAAKFVDVAENESPEALERMLGVYAKKNKKTGEYDLSGMTKEQRELHAVVQSLYENKETGKLKRETPMLKIIEQNMDMFTERTGDGDIRLSRSNYKGSGVSMSEIIDDVGPNETSEKFGKLSTYIGENSWFGTSARLLRSIGTDIDDIKDAGIDRKQNIASLDAQYENIRNPYLEKTVGEINSKVGKSGKVGEQMLDVLRIVAGTTVINKVTTVRPDYYQTFGDLSGGNVRQLGKMGYGDITAALNNRVPRSGGDGHQPSFSQTINGRKTATVN